MIPPLNEALKQFFARIPHYMYDAEDVPRCIYCDTREGALHDDECLLIVLTEEIEYL